MYGEFKMPSCAAVPADLIFAATHFSSRDFCSPSCTETLPALAGPFAR